MGTFHPAVLWTTEVHWRREEAKMKTVALFCCVLASAIADFVPASEEGNTFKKVDAEEAEREGKAFRSVSGDGVLIADGAGEIVVAPGLGGAVVGSVAGPVAVAARLNSSLSWSPRSARIPSGMSAPPSTPRCARNVLPPGPSRSAESML